MNSSRRWLVGFAISIGAVAVIAVALVLLTQGKNVTLLAADTPQGTVQRYLLALQNNDYRQAYTYFSRDTPGMISYNDWLTQNGNPAATKVSWQAALGNTVQNGPDATVTVTIETAYPDGMMNSSNYSQQIEFFLTGADNSWLITSPTYTYWIY